MTAPELRRKLLYCGYGDVTDYLRNSPLNRYIYKKLLVLMPMHDIDIPIVSIFNEVYFQCVRVRFDSKPGFNVPKRYFPEVEAQYGNNLSAAQLVFCLVWVLFQLKKTLTFAEECFVEQIEPYVHNIPTSTFRKDADAMVEELKSMGAKVPDVFPAMPCPIEEICIIDEDEIGLQRKDMKLAFSSIFFDKKYCSPVGPKLWEDVTDNFSIYAIESFVKIYTEPEDQELLLEAIFLSCIVCGPPDKPIKNSDKIQSLLNNLQRIIVSKRGAGDNDCEIATASVADSDDKDNDLMRSMAMQKYLQEHPETEESDETPDEKLQRLEAECNSLAQKNAELRVHYENALEEAKDQYTCQIEALKERLATFENQPVEEVKKNAPAIGPEDLPLPLIEIVEYAKQHFGESVGKEVSTMLMRLALKHSCHEEATFTLIDSIEEEIRAKHSLLQKFEFSHVEQLNVNPNKVDNKYTKE